MNRFRLPQFGLGPAPSVPLVNTFRDAAILFEGDAVTALPLIHRMMELHMNAVLAGIAPATNKAADLLALKTLLPTEACVLVISDNEQKKLNDYLRLQIYELVRDKQSPFYDVKAQAVYNALLAVLYVVENYTSIRTFWPCRT
jgi:hypothetical protein